MLNLMNNPLIGLTTFRHISNSGLSQISITEAYVSALLGAGAAPVLIPLGLPEPVLRSIFERLDGIVFTGGGDVHPSSYHGLEHPLVDDVDPDRDRIEIELIHQAWRSSKPFLGICRGLQVINVAMGGTLYEDILDQRPDSQRHQFWPEKSRNHLAHPVAIEPGSRLAAILGVTQPHVNSFHHQGIRVVAPSLRVAAYAPDGVIEAVELPDHPFGLAVQWHPEWLVKEHEAMGKLFQALVQHADRGSEFLASN
jgi:putative glutamine amidotransferase